MPNDLNNVAGQQPQVPQNEPNLDPQDNGQAPYSGYGYAPPIDDGVLTPNMPNYAPSPDALEAQLLSAKKMLGIEELEKKLTFSEEQARYKDNMLEVLNKYPELSKEKIEEELSRIEKESPEIARDLKTSKSGMDILARGLKSTINPDKKPDDITDDNSTSAQNDDGDPLLEKIKNKKADKAELGAYLNSFLK